MIPMIPISLPQPFCVQLPPQNFTAVEQLVNGNACNKNSTGVNNVDNMVVLDHSLNSNVVHFSPPVCPSPTVSATIVPDHHGDHTDHSEHDLNHLKSSAASSSAANQHQKDPCSKNAALVPEVAENLDHRHPVLSPDGALEMPTLNSDTMTAILDSVTVAVASVAAQTAATAVAAANWDGHPGSSSRFIQPLDLYSQILSQLADNPYRARVVNPSPESPAFLRKPTMTSPLSLGHGKRKCCDFCGRWFKFESTHALPAHRQIYAAELLNKCSHCIQISSSFSQIRRNETEHVSSDDHDMDEPIDYASADYVKAPLENDFTSTPTPQTSGIGSKAPDLGMPNINFDPRIAFEIATAAAAIVAAKTCAGVIAIPAANLHMNPVDLYTQVLRRVGDESSSGVGISSAPISSASSSSSHQDLGFEFNKFVTEQKKDSANLKPSKSNDSSTKCDLIDLTKEPKESLHLTSESTNNKPPSKKLVNEDEYAAKEFSPSFEDLMEMESLKEASSNLCSSNESINKDNDKMESADYGVKDRANDDDKFCHVSDNHASDSSKPKVKRSLEVDMHDPVGLTCRSKDKEDSIGGDSLPAKRTPSANSEVEELISELGLNRVAQHIEAYSQALNKFMITPASTNPIVSLNSPPVGLASPFDLLQLQWSSSTGPCQSNMYKRLKLDSPEEGKIAGPWTDYQNLLKPGGLNGNAGSCGGSGSRTASSANAEKGVEEGSGRTSPCQGPMTPWACDSCTKMFKSYNDLLTHQKIHARRGREKRYKCKICGFAFGQERGLREHMKVHGEPGDDVYRCRFCDTPYVLLRTLRKHLKECGINQNILAAATAMCDLGSQSFPPLKYHQTEGDESNIGQLCEYVYRCCFCDVPYVSRTLNKHMKECRVKFPAACTMFDKGTKSFPNP